MIDHNMISFDANPFGIFSYPASRHLFLSFIFVLLKSTKVTGQQLVHNSLFIKVCHQLIWM